MFVARRAEDVVDIGFRMTPCPVMMAGRPRHEKRHQVHLPLRHRSHLFAYAPRDSNMYTTARMIECGAIIRCRPESFSPPAILRSMPPLPGTLIAFRGA